MLTSQVLPLTQGDHYVNRYAVTTDAGVVVRSDTRDIHELDEARHFMTARDVRRDQILHIGAGVGCFMGLAVQRGCKHFQAVEPEQSRFKVLQINADKQPGNSCRAVRAMQGHRLGKASMTWKVDGHATTQHNLIMMPLPNLMYTKPSMIIMTSGGNELEGWTRQLGYDTRTVILKTDRAHATRDMAAIEAKLPGMKRHVFEARFIWSPAVWFEWRRD